MKNLEKFGDAYTKFTREVRESIESKTDEELKEIEYEAKYAKPNNTELAEFRVSKLVLEYALYEIRMRQKAKILMNAV
jgi:hypothetical protein